MQQRRDKEVTSQSSHCYAHVMLHLLFVDNIALLCLVHVSRYNAHSKLANCRALLFRNANSPLTGI